jgi:hypothetical protein
MKWFKPPGKLFVPLMIKSRAGAGCFALQAQAASDLWLGFFMLGLPSIDYFILKLAAKSLPSEFHPGLLFSVFAEQNST